MLVSRDLKGEEIERRYSGRREKVCVKAKKKVRVNEKVKECVRKRE